MKHFLLLCATWCTALFHIAVQAQTEFPTADSSFYGVGYHVYEECSFFEVIDMAVQSDGKIIALGYGNLHHLDGDLDAVLARIYPDGTLDTEFGENGFKGIDVDGGADKVSGVSILADGKILLLLESAYRSFLVRLHPDGSYDSSFGNEGFVLVPTSEYERSNAMVMQDDQKVLIVSDLSTPSRYILTVRRCMPDGTLDESYGDQGRTYIDMLPQSITDPRALLQNDGKLLLTGYYGYLNTSGFAAIRLNTDGSLDHTFSVDGIYTKTLGNAVIQSSSESIAVNTDGAIYLGGQIPSNIFQANLGVLGLTANGSINAAFGVAGVSTLYFGNFASARTLHLQSDGKILATGYVALDQSSTAFALARLNPDGSADDDFGDGGKVTLSPFIQDFKLQIFNTSSLAPNGVLTCMGWLRQTLDFSDKSITHLEIHRFLIDIKVKAEEPNAVFQELMVFPTLQNESSTLQLSYTLAEAGNINISLYDEKGAWIKTLATCGRHEAGPQQDECVLPQGLPAGTYYVVLDNGLQVKPVKVLKV